MNHTHTRSFFTICFLILYSFFLYGQSTASDSLKDINKIDKNEQKQGYWQIISPHSICEGNYVDNKREGDWLFSHKSGIYEEGYYKNNIKVKIWKSYYQDGNLLSKIKYPAKGGSKFSKYWSYHSNGNLKFKIKKSFSNLLIFTYHENGKLESKGKFTIKSEEIGFNNDYDIERTGKWKYYSDYDGSLSKTVIYKNGIAANSNM